MLHANTGSAVASHGVADEAPALALRNRTVMRINVCDQVSSDEQLEITGGHGTRIHRTVVERLRIGQHYDHFFRALRKGAFDRLRYMDFMRPLLGADGETVQSVNNWIASGLFLGITRGKEHKYIAINGVSF